MRYSAFTIFILSAIAFVSCGKLDYKKTGSGLVYKIFSDGKGDSVKTGDYIKFHISLSPFLISGGSCTPFFKKVSND